MTERPNWAPPESYEQYIRRLHDDNNVGADDKLRAELIATNAPYKMHLYATFMGQRLGKALVTFPELLQADIEGWLITATKHLSHHKNFRPSFIGFEIIQADAKKDAEFMLIDQLGRKPK